MSVDNTDSCVVDRVVLLPPTEEGKDVEVTITLEEEKIDALTGRVDIPLLGLIGGLPLLSITEPVVWDVSCSVVLKSAGDSVDVIFIAAPVVAVEKLGSVEFTVVNVLSGDDVILFDCSDVVVGRKVELIISFSVLLSGCETVDVVTSEINAVVETILVVDESVDSAAEVIPLVILSVVTAVVKFILPVTVDEAVFVVTVVLLPMVDVTMSVIFTVVGDAGTDVLFTAAVVDDVVEVVCWVVTLLTDTVLLITEGVDSEDVALVVAE